MPLSDDDFSLEMPEETPAFGGWRNPPLEVRVMLTAVVFAVPGILAGLMACLLTPSSVDQHLAAGVGGLIGFAVGVWVESES
ncbi:hypothetical protein [Zavarzinella formosa]|uniref:hypothetical protein n=1 Tax=Zavarzinella formosa TaxID=360055 RepID=UPI0002ED7365|nr:hypothetical protein [Zavarzinella formosa]